MIFFSNFSSIYVGSEVAEAPLIVWPHGGPHSAIPWAFSTDLYYFLDQGFSCLLINYRGSISQGISSSHYLSFFWLKNPYTLNCGCSWTRFIYFAWKLLKLKITQIENCQNWKLPKSKITKIEICYNWKLPNSILP